MLILRKTVLSSYFNCEGGMNLPIALKKQ